MIHNPLTYRGVMYHLFITFLLYSLFGTSIYAFTYPTDEQLNTLSKMRGWHNLLYYNRSEHESEVTDKSFFLSQRGKYDPAAELNATINAYLNTRFLHEEKNAQCRFPARYVWINRHIPLPDFQPLPHTCKTLQKKLSALSAGSISLMYVSGYLKNPASAFGHTFIKINSSRSRTDLFDQTLSYGALVPDHENIFLYIFRGIFGRYSAKFSDKYFFTNDLVYTKGEFRDIYEYELSLTPQEKNYLLMHMIEITGKSFQYFFLSRNCAYAGARLLQNGTDQNIAEEDNPAWYLPLQPIQNLRKQKRIKKIRYHPSRQKKLYAHYTILTPEEKLIVKKIVKKSSDISRLIVSSELTPQQQREVIDFLIELYGYYLVIEPENRLFKERLKNALSQRLQLPAAKRVEGTPKMGTTPDKSNAPSSFRLYLGHNRNIKSYTGIALSPFYYTNLAQNHLNGNRFILLNIALGIDNKKIKNLFIDKIDLVDIENYNRTSLPFDLQNNYAWKLKIGMQKYARKNQLYTYYIRYAI